MLVLSGGTMMRVGVPVRYGRDDKKRTFRAPVALMLLFVSAPVIAALTFVGGMRW
jgi:hypothetical protein